MQCYAVYFIWKLLYIFWGGATTQHQERKQLYLQHMIVVTSLLLPAAIAAGSNNGLTISDTVDTVVCALDDGWWYHPKHVEQFQDKIICVTLHLVRYILEYFYDERNYER
jgi:hypothetical protein